VTAVLKTSWIRILPEDVMPGFDPKNDPDPGDYWDPELLAPSEEWNKLRMLWTKVNAYVRLHAKVPEHDAYEIPVLIKNWADTVIDGVPPKPLMIYGNVGVGKTYGTSAVACYLAAFWDRNLYTSAPAVAFHTASMLVGGLKNFGSAEAREELLHSVSNAKVLVIDDLTRFKATDFDMETLGQIIDTRQAKKLPTIVTLNDLNNPSVDLAEKLPQFLASRLLAGVSIPVYGEDRRTA
jgi:chromosomal replication initiation ATPase DnaA